MRGCVIIAVLTGCNQVLGLDRTKVGSIDAPGCSASMFAGMSMLTDGMGIVHREPAMRADGLELWFAVETPGPYRHIRRASRTSVAEPFVVSTDVPPFSDEVASNERAASLTADGLRLVFTSNRGGSLGRAYETTRAALDQPFSPAVQLTALGSNISSIDISHDGLRVYFTGVDAILMTAERSALDQSFAAPVSLDFVAYTPSISPDELEVFYMRDGFVNEISRRVRTATTLPFESVETLVISGRDPDVAANGSQMVFASNRDIYMTERGCP